MIRSCIYMAIFIFMVVDYVVADFFAKEMDLIPYVKDKTASITIDQYAAELLHVEKKEPLNQQQIQEWVVGTLKKMKIDENHPKYNESYNKLYEQHQYQTASTLRNLKITKTKNFYIISQKPVSADRLMAQESSPQDDLSYVFTMINDYGKKKYYLIDHVNKSILESEDSAWSEEWELNNMFLPENTLSPFVAIVDDKNKKLNWSLKRTDHQSTTDFDEVFNFSFVTKQGTQGSYGFFFQMSGDDLLLKKMEFYSDDKLMKQSEWNDFQYNDELKSNVARSYKILLYNNENKLILQKEYKLHSYQLNEQVDDVSTIETLLKTYKGYRIGKANDTTKQVESLGIVGVDYLQ